MKKSFLIAALVGLTTSAYAAKDPVVGNVGYGGIGNYQMVNYKYNEARGEQNIYPWYVGAALGLNFNNFKMDGIAHTDPVETSSDSFSFKQTTGFELMGGYLFAPKWRAELNYGQSGEFSQQDSDGSFIALSTQWIMANALYTVKQWTDTSIYAGAGAGLSLLKTEFTNVAFEDDNDVETNTTFAVQGILGVEQAISSNLSLMAEYRLRYAGGAKHERVIIGGVGLDAEFSEILTNSVVIGAKVKF